MSRRFICSVLPILLVGMAVPASGQLTDALRNLTRSAEPSKKIAHFKIKEALMETPTKIPPLFGSEPPQSLKGLLERFKEARLDGSVVAVIVDLQNAQLGMAQLQELHGALRKFTAVDKEVYVQADQLTTLTYAAATGASHISVVPTGEVWLTGIYGEQPYLRGTLDKLGCIPDFETCGDYKTAPEVFTHTAPSEESRRMTDWLLDGIYVALTDLMAESRGVTPEQMRELVDRGPYTAEEALAVGLIDSVKHRQDFVADIERRYGASVDVVLEYGKKDELDIPQDPFAMIPWLMEKLNPSPRTYTAPSVAIVYVEGPIQTGSAEQTPFGPASGAFSTTIRKALDEAADDDSVRAVVLRVDSPGGSALASEIILNASRRVAARKPLIVSMGNVAASGGYYVSCGSDTIFADEATITGSIGVLGGKIVTEGMWDKLGVNWYPVQRGEMAAIFSTQRPFTDAERKKIVDYLNTIYDTFKEHVVTARREHLKKPIDEVAGGRVYTGRQALELGLVDRIGGLEEAIRFAAQEARLGDYEIRVIPEPPSLFDLLMGGRKQDKDFSRAMVDAPLVRAVLPMLAQLDPQRSRAVLRALQGLEILRQEGAVMFMPEVVIRSR